MTRTLLLVALALTLAPGCGGGARSTDALRSELEALDLERAAEHAPDLVASARAAYDDAVAAERRGDLVEAADDATLARLYASAAVEEEARIAADEARLEVERELLADERRLLAITDETAAVSAEARRFAAAHVAREEGARALARAELDEARPARAAHVSLADATEMRNAARAIRERARILVAAAVAMGETSTTRIEDLLAQSESVDSPIAAVSLADRAHEAARMLLAAARRNHLGVDESRIASLIEAAESEGFHAVRMERGTAIEVEGVFEGSSPRPTAAASARLSRLAVLVASYPDGPVRVEVDAPSAADASRRARARADAIVHALIGGGLDASRVSVADAPATTATSTRARIVLIAYAAVPPLSGGTIDTAPHVEETDPAPPSSE